MSSDKFLELKDNVCATKEHSILLSLVSNANDGKIDTDVVEEINVPPNSPTREELEEVITATLRPTLSALCLV